ncbi:hypothetical protein DYQ86_26820 [Acidobacteria bacterium AB60]|nr:hypothetical protein DYQ86_26820 [Acidobacteria bacterium AB60]
MWTAGAITWCSNRWAAKPWLDRQSDGWTMPRGKTPRHFFGRDDGDRLRKNGAKIDKFPESGRFGRVGDFLWRERRRLLIPGSRRPSSKGSRSSQTRDVGSCAACRVLVPQQAKSIMSAAALIYIPSSEVESNRSVSAHAWTIELSASICSDRTRLHSVLTIPEYMELWMRLPEAATEGHLVVREFPGGFRVTGESWVPASPVITARYRTSRRNKLIFTWEHQQFGETRESVVAIRLAGDFGKTNVHVKHLGTGSREEYEWHSFFWRQSLSRLSGLFQKTA